MGPSRQISLALMEGHLISFYNPDDVPCSCPRLNLYFDLYEIDHVVEFSSPPADSTLLHSLTTSSEINDVPRRLGDTAGPNA